MFDQLVTFLYTRDLARSAAFYGDTLGLPLALDQGGCRIYRVSPDGFLGLCRCSEARPCNPDGVIVTFVSGGGPMRPTAIAQAIGKKPGTTRMSLSRMRQAGEIIALADGTYQAVE